MWKRGSRTTALGRRAAVIVLAMAGGVLSIGTGPAAAATTGDVTTDDVTIMAGCDNHPGVPDWFYPTLQRAANNTNDAVPRSWGSGDQGWAMMKIICNESSFRTGAVSPSGNHFGLGQLLRANVRAARVRWACYWDRDACNRIRAYYQCLAALRYANQRYGSPLRGWNHFKDVGWW